MAEPPEGRVLAATPPTLASRTTVANIAEKAGVSPSTARRHLIRARDRGIVIEVARPGYAEANDYYRPVRLPIPSKDGRRADG